MRYEHLLQRLEHTQAGRSKSFQSTLAPWPHSAQAVWYGSSRRFTGDYPHNYVTPSQLAWYRCVIQGYSWKTHLRGGSNCSALARVGRRTTIGGGRRRFIEKRAHAKGRQNIGTRLSCCMVSCSMQHLVDQRGLPAAFRTYVTYTGRSLAHDQQQRRLSF